MHHLHLHRDQAGPDLMDRCISSMQVFCESVIGPEVADVHYLNLQGRAAGLIQKVPA